MVFLDSSSCESGECFPLLEVASNCSIICKIFRKDSYYHLNMLPKGKRERERVCVCLRERERVCVCVFEREREKGSESGENRSAGVAISSVPGSVSVMSSGWSGATSVGHVTSQTLYALSG